MHNRRWVETGELIKIPIPYNIYTNKKLNLEEKYSFFVVVVDPYVLQ